ncbi:MAG: hypothetical protein DRJ47_09200 [Thermoprotei archaeon]|nr:MAG: hypothetical protein DRJ47_09200 [Thermoprotei archaeon]
MGLEEEGKEVYKEALEVVRKVSESLGSGELVPISRAHISGVSYVNIGDAGLEFIRDLAERGGRFRVATTLNPVAVDLEKWKEMDVPEEIVSKQKEIVELLVKMGAKPTLTCTPYLIDPPKRGEQVAWGESNAVLYANSVLGARTNREGGPLTILEAICGKAPYLGLRIDEGRKPTVEVYFEKEVWKAVENRKIPYSALGYSLGLAVGRGVPLLMETRLPFKHIKNFLAAVGASSSIGLVLIRGLSPEVKESNFYREKVEKISLSLTEVEDSIEKFRKKAEKADAVFLGCPHLSPSELREIFYFLEKKGWTPRKKVILSTSRWALNQVGGKICREKMDKVIILSDTCIVVSPIEYMNVKHVVTDSAKAAYYLSNKGLDVTLLPRKTILGDII